MSAISLTNWLVGLSLRDREKVLNAIAFELTIQARAYNAAFEKEADKVGIRNPLIGINELQHKILSQVGHYLDNDEKVYPVEVFGQILLQVAEAYNLMPALNASITRIRTRVLRAG